MRYKNINMSNQDGVVNYGLSTALRRNLPSNTEFQGNNAEVYENRSGLKKIKVSATKRALQLISFKSNSSILDVGCGTGWSTEVILDAGFDVVGVDISRDMLEIARNKRNLNVVEGDLRKLPFSDKSFDGIVSISTLNFIAESCKSVYEVRENYKLSAREFWRVLKDQGKAVIEYYPRSSEELRISMREFSNIGFNGGLIIENSGYRKTEKFLLLTKTE